jgi:hypothetical protein
MWPNATVNRAAANQHGFQKPRGPQLRWNRLFAVLLLLRLKGPEPCALLTEWGHRDVGRLA